MNGLSLFIGGSEDTKRISPSSYDPNEVITYRYGLTCTLSGAAGTAEEVTHSEAVAGSGLDNDTSKHFGIAQHWDVKPGFRRITGFNYRGAYLQATHIDSYAIDVWRDDSTFYTLIATTGLIAADAGSTGSMHLTKTLATPLEVTLVAGQKYYIGFRVHRTNAGIGYPYLNTTSAEAFVQDSFAFVAAETALAGNTLTKATVAGTSKLYTTLSAQAPLFYVTYTSGNYIEQEIVNANVINKAFILATPLTAEHVIKLEGLVVGDTKSLTGVFRDFLGNATAQTVDTFELDCGNTVALQNDLIFKGNTVNLPAIGGATQAGTNFDLIFGVRPQAGNTLKYDCYYLNRFRDDGFHAHAVKNSVTRGTLYTYTTNAARFATVKFTGDYNSLDKIVVGARPMVLIGDSQVITNSGNSALRQPNTSRWGALPSQLAKPRMWILLGHAGMFLGFDATGIDVTKWKSATPGAGDGCELLGLGCEWFFAGVGINDCNYNITAYTLDKGVRRAVANVINTYTSICSLIHQAGERIYIAGLPPFSYNTAGYGADAEFRGKTPRYLNRGLLGLALAWKIPYYNPWPDMVMPGTENDTVPKFNYPYTDDDGEADLGDDGLHYSAAGGAVVRPKMISTIEQGTIDTRDMLS